MTTDQDAERKPRLVFGQDRICPRCRGIGTIDTTYKAPSAKVATTTTSTCARCEGTGRIE